MIWLLDCETDWNGTSGSSDIFPLWEVGLSRETALRIGLVTFTIRTEVLLFAITKYWKVILKMLDLYSLWVFRSFFPPRQAPLQSHFVSCQLPKVFRSKRFFPSFSHYFPSQFWVSVTSPLNQILCGWLTYKIWILGVYQIIVHINADRHLIDVPQPQPRFNCWALSSMLIVIDHLIPPVVFLQEAKMINVAGAWALLSEPFCSPIGGHHKHK